MSQPSDILSAVRPLVVDVDGSAVVRGVFGGFGGFLGLDVDAMVGRSVFDFLPPADAAELATYLLESVDQAFTTVSLPLPFRIGVIGGDGDVHPVDVIVAGRDTGDDTWNWVATLVPASLEATISRPLDALVEQQPRAIVKSLLADEFTVDNSVYSTRGFMIDLSEEPPRTYAARSADSEVADAITDAVVDGWEPWVSADDADTVAVPVDALPDMLRACAEQRHWRRVAVTVVRDADQPVAVFVMMGRVPDEYSVDDIPSNTVAHYRHVARMTALVMGGWRDRDQLEWAATHDPLTGVANRRRFDTAVESSPPDAALLFIDVDSFKSVNDRFGHRIGDEVLVEIARRIRIGCGPEPLVARIGGDEFGVVVADPDGPDPHEIAAAVAESVAAPWEIPGGPAAVGVSVGVVVGIGSGDAMARGSAAMKLEKIRNRR